MNPVDQKEALSNLDENGEDGEPQTLAAPRCAELGSLKDELFGMASRSPNSTPLFAKEVETKWAAKETRSL